MAKSLEKIKARELRSAGESIKEIAKQLRVSKSSASIWCRDIELAPEQIAKLSERIKMKGSYEARIKGARVIHERRMKQIEELRQTGSQLLPSLSKQDLFCIGIGLYWGEGTKGRKAAIANSDSRILKLMIQWFEEIWAVSRDRFSCHILINEIHKHRIEEVEAYWSKTLDIPISQFTKTVLIRAKNKKVYKNFSQHYGTLVLRIRKGTDLLHKINGLIDSIAEIDYIRII